MKVKVGLGMIATVVALAAPSAANAAILTYGGSIAGGTAESKIAVDVKVSRKGVIKKVTELRAVEIPINCEQSGAQTAYTTIPVSLPVDGKGRFSFEYTDPVYGNTSSINGVFKPNGRAIAGRFVYANHFPAEGGLPEEDCASPLLGFKVKLGGADVIPPSRSR